MPRIEHTALSRERAEALRTAWLSAAPRGTVWLAGDPAARDRWRHTLLLAAPRLEVRVMHGNATVYDREGRLRKEGAVGEILESLFATLPVKAEVERARTGEQCFCGGLAGYLGYEHGSAYERVVRPPRDDLYLFDAWFGLYDEWIEWRATGEVVHGQIATPWSEADTSRWRLLEPPSPPAKNASGHHYASPLAPLYAPALVPEWPAVRSTHDQAHYEACVRALVGAIHRGDLFQANLSQRFALDARSRPPAAWYERLTEALRPGFGAFLAVPSTAALAGHTPPGWVLSASPERLIEVLPDDPPLLRTDPIKGTRPRGRDAAADQALAAELLASEKDRAENRMIVDLMRNDLSRVCRPGSIRVPRLLSLETYPALHHLVSTVEGRLRDEASLGALLAAIFPAGSITGAPKVQAMHEIRRHEPYPRGPYTGSIGYFGFDGSAELSVAIRTVSLRADGQALVGAGGGIVADSEPHAEYAETLVKARALLEALGA